MKTYWKIRIKSYDVIIIIIWNLKFVMEKTQPFILNIFSCDFDVKWKWGKEMDKFSVLEINLYGEAFEEMALLSGKTCR